MVVVSEPSREYIRWSSGMGEKGDYEPFHPIQDWTAMETR